MTPSNFSALRGFFTASGINPIGCIKNSFLSFPVKLKEIITALTP